MLFPQWPYPDGMFVILQKFKRRYTERPAGLVGLYTIYNVVANNSAAFDLLLAACYLGVSLRAGLFTTSPRTAKSGAAGFPFLSLTQRLTCKEVLPDEE